MNMNEILQNDCMELAKTIRCNRDPRAITAAEDKIIATAMLMAGYVFNTYTGLYEKADKKVTEIPRNLSIEMDIRKVAMILRLEIALSAEQIRL